MDEQPAILHYCDELFKASYDGVKQFHDSWEVNWKYFRGEQWHNQEIPIANGNKITVNLFFNLIQQSIAHQTSGRPTVRRVALTNDEETVRGTDFLNRLDPIFWEELHLTTLFAEALFYANIAQGTFIQRYYDQRANKNLGGYGLRARDPFTCYPDLGCRSDRLQEDAEYFILAESKPLAYVRQRWPEKADQIRASMGKGEADERLKDRYGAAKDAAREVGFKLVSSNTTNYPEGKASSDFKEENFTTIYTAYLRQEFVEQEFRFWQKNKEGIGNIKNDKVDTPWRQIIYVPGVLLSDSPSRFYDGELPLIRCSTSPLPGSIWSVDECAQLRPLQDLYNRLISQVMNHIDRMVDPDVYYNPVQTGIEESWLKRTLRRKKYRPVKGNANSAVWADRPQNLGPEVGLLLSEIPRLMEAILAQPEILQGGRPSGARSGEALKVLTVNAMPRTTKKSQEFETCIKETVEKATLDWLVGQPMGVIERAVGGEVVKFYPRDYVGLAMRTEVVPGSSLPSYSDQKMAKMVEFLTATQGIQDPNMIAKIAQNSDIPELRELVSQGQQQIAPLQGLYPGAPQQPQQPQQAMNIPIDLAV